MARRACQDGPAGGQRRHRAVRKGAQSRVQTGPHECGTRDHCRYIASGHQRRFRDEDGRLIPWGARCFVACAALGHVLMAGKPYASGRRPRSESVAAYLAGSTTCCAVIEDAHAINHCVACATVSMPTFVLVAPSRRCGERCHPFRRRAHACEQSGHGVGWRGR